MAEDSDDSGDDWLDKAIGNGRALTGKNVLVEACKESESDEESEESDEEAGEQEPREEFGTEVALTRGDLYKPLWHHRNAADENGSETEERSAHTGPVEEGGGGHQEAVLTRPSAICQHSPVEHSGLVYKWTNKVNGRGYVGKAKNGNRRYWEHAGGRAKSGRGKLQLIDKKIQQYGLQNFKYEVLEDNIPNADLLDAEAKWMRSENTLVPNGYNILKPGVEVISMSDPEIRARWEAAFPEAMRKATATKRANREATLAKMDPEVADALRDRLDKEAVRNGKRHRGEEMDPDGRFGRNDKRRATCAAKREARMALMTPEARAKYERINATKRRSDEKRLAKRMKANRAAKHVAWLKGYRQATKDRRVMLGK